VQSRTRTCTYVTTSARDQGSLLPRSRALLYTACCLRSTHASSGSRSPALADCTEPGTGERFPWSSSPWTIPKDDTMGKLSGTGSAAFCQEAGKHACSHGSTSARARTRCTLTEARRAAGDQESRPTHVRAGSRGKPPVRCKAVA
jgi:hypothetical protein